jgi:nickel/cobalt transporter (NiCoT) family protein
MENLTSFSNNFSGIILMLSLGLKHGIDPDHIAIIDGMTMKHNLENSKWAIWVGTLFAIGHGLVITVVAMFLSQMTTTINFPYWLTAIAEWIPILLLVLVGSLNLRSLLSKQSYKVIGWRAKLLPKKLITSSSPFAIILVGILFATVFDTASQAAAWGYSASQKGGLYAAGLMGIVFTIGMIITDTIDNRILNRTLYKSNNPLHIKQYRLYIGWAIVIMSFLMAGYKITSALVPALKLSDKASLFVGFSFILFALGAYIIALYKNYQNKFNVG